MVGHDEAGVWPFTLGSGDLRRVSLRPYAPRALIVMTDVGLSQACGNQVESTLVPYPFPSPRAIIIDSKRRDFSLCRHRAAGVVHTLRGCQIDRLAVQRAAHSLHFSLDGVGQGAGVGRLAPIRTGEIVGKSRDEC